MAQSPPPPQPEEQLDEEEQLEDEQLEEEQLPDEQLPDEPPSSLPLSLSDQIPLPQPLEAQEDEAPDCCPASRLASSSVSSSCICSLKPVNSVTE